MKTGLPEIRSHTALRGIAALCVVLYHCVLFQKETGYLSFILSGLPVLSDWLLMSTLVVVFTLIAASASCHLLERPSQRWLTRRLAIPPA